LFITQYSTIRQQYRLTVCAEFVLIIIDRMMLYQYHANAMNFVHGTMIGECELYSL